MRPAIPARTGRHRLRDSRSDKVRFSSCASPATCLYLFPCPPYRVISSSGHVAGTGGSTNTTGSIFGVLSGVEGVCRASFVLFVPWTRFLSSSHTPPPTSSPRHPPETSSTPPLANPSHLWRSPPQPPFRGTVCPWFRVLFQPLPRQEHPRPPQGGRGEAHPDDAPRRWSPGHGARAGGRHGGAVSVR